jgi:type IVB pilus formation R64 PilN family outer membrane protein
MKITHILGTVVLALLAAGCAGHTQPIVKSASTDAQSDAQVGMDQFRSILKNSEGRRLAAQDVARPYIAGETRPLSREVQMPAQLRQSIPVTALFQNSEVDLGAALSQLSRASGILLTATPDALLPASAFAMRTGGNSPVQAPLRVTLNAQQQPLWTLLDDIARQAQVSWRPVRGGAEFFRVETRVFTLSAIPQTANTSSSLGRNGGNTVFENQSKTSFETKSQNQMDGIRVAVEAMLTTGGKAIIAQENQTLIVTDTPEVLERVSAFVSEQNKVLSRRVRVILEAIEVVSKNGSDLGVDWTAVLNTASNALVIKGPGSVVESQAARFGLQQMSGPLSGSSVVVQALNEVGTVINRRVFPLVTTSGRPVTQALRTTFNYVDQVQVTALSSSTTQVSQAPTVSQKEETVGTFLTIVPTAKSDGSIILGISFDVTSADPLRPFTVGSGSNAVTVQQKTINGSGIVQEVAVRSGRTEILGGIDLTNLQDISRRLGDGAPMIIGGSDTSKYSKSVTLMLVTAIAEDGV